MSKTGTKSKRIVLNEKWDIYRDPYNWVTVQKIVSKKGVYEKHNFHPNLNMALKFILETEPNLEGTPEIITLEDVVKRQQMLYKQIDAVFNKDFQDCVRSQLERKKENE